MKFTDIFKIDEFKRINSEQALRISEMQNKLSEIGADRYDDVTKIVSSLNVNRVFLESQVESLRSRADMLSNDNQSSQISLDDLNRKITSQQRKLAKVKELYKSVDHSYKTYVTEDNYLLLSQNDVNILDELVPSVILQLHHMDVKALNSAFRDNDRLIEKVLTQYAARYTTKAYQTMYKLMVVALRAELQNILYDLKYGTIEKSIADIKKITAKYLKFATEGNQLIAGTMAKFIGEIEYLFINAAKIEYNYYVKKEQIKQEQLALRQQMREEAEERKQLELEKKRVIQEETKFINEIDKTRLQLDSTVDPSEIDMLKSKLLDLEAKLSDISIQKEKITELQNGKAGSVYIISNRGSFGESIFKIGMTRRIDPLERINELGSASVPFRFDIHSMVFSEDAVNLENELHKRLDAKRVNRVNMRKEFFYSSLDELEELVNQLDPAAEFVKSMLANEYNQSISSSENFDSVITLSSDNEDDEEEDTNL